MSQLETSENERWYYSYLCLGNRYKPRLKLRSMFVHCVCGARRCCVLEPWANNQEQHARMFEGKTILLNRIPKFKLESEKKQDTVWNQRSQGQRDPVLYLKLLKWCAWRAKKDQRVVCGSLYQWAHIRGNRVR